MGTVSGFVICLIEMAFGKNHESVAFWEAMVYESLPDTSGWEKQPTHYFLAELKPAVGMVVLSNWARWPPGGGQPQKHLRILVCNLKPEVLPSDVDLIIFGDLGKLQVACVGALLEGKNLEMRLTVAEEVLGCKTYALGPYSVSGALVFLQNL